MISLTRSLVPLHIGSGFDFVLDDLFLPSDSLNSCWRSHMRSGKSLSHHLTRFNYFLGSIF